MKGYNSETSPEPTDVKCVSATFPKENLPSVSKEVKVLERDLYLLLLLLLLLYMTYKANAFHFLHLSLLTIYCGYIAGCCKQNLQPT